MAELTVRDLEVEMVQRLQERADRHGVSAEEEHRRILRQVLNEPESEFPDLKALLQATPQTGRDCDFERIREFPKEIDLSGL